MRLIVLVLLALLAGNVMAEALTWTPPTERVDGTPLDPMTEIAEYQLVCGEVVTSIEPTMQEGNRYEYRKHEILPGYGRHDCRLAAVDTDGLSSDASEPVSIEWVKTAPLAPTDVVLIKD